MRLVKALGTLIGVLFGLALLAVLVLVVLAKFGNAETRYRCDGVVGLQDGRSKRMTIFLKTELHTSLIFWADSAGWIYSEVPNGELEFYPNAQFIGDFLQFSNSDHKKLGGLSSLSKALWLDTQDGRFEGICRTLRPDA